MSAERNAALVRRLVDEVWNRGDFSGIQEMFAETYVTPGRSDLVGPEAEREHIEMIRTWSPDLHIAIEELVADAERVAVRWTMSGTDGGFLGRLATGKRFTYWGVDFFQFRDGRIAAGWVGVDMLGVLIQLGVVPSPWPSGA